MVGTPPTLSPGDPSPSRPARARTTDLGFLLVGAVILFAIAIGVVAGFMFITRSNSTSCGLQAAGAVSDLTEEIDESPVFQVAGEECAYWLDTVGDDIAAYRYRQPLGSGGSVENCVLKWRGRDNTYTCGPDRVKPDRLARYPTWHTVQAGIPTLFVDLRPQTCSRYDLGIKRRLEERLDADGAARIDVQDCGSFWISLDRGGALVVVPADTDACEISRSKAGALLCDGKRIDPHRLPQHPLVAGRAADTVAVDVTTLS